MAKFNNIYEVVGLTKLIDFIEPPVVKSDSLIIPDETIFYYFKPTDALESVSRSIPYFSNLNKVNVVTPTNFGSITEGSFKLNNDPKETISILQKEEKKFKFLPPNVIENKGNNIIYNYGCLNYLYSYTNSPNINLNKYNNVANRMLDDLKSLSSYNRIILFDIPKNLPSMSELDSFSKKLSNVAISKLDYRYFNLIELWKWLTPETKSTSLFNRIANSKLGLTNLLVSFENKSMLINLDYLYTIVEEYSSNKYSVNTESLDNFLRALGYNDINLETSSYVSEKAKAETIRYLLYITLSKFLTSTPSVLSKVDKSVNKDIAMKKLVRTAKSIAKKDKLSVNDVLKEYEDENRSDLIDLDLDTFIPEIGDFDLTEIDKRDAEIAKATNRVFESIEELKKYNYRDELAGKTLKELDYLLETKAISKATYKSYLDSFNKQNDLKNPFIVGKDGGTVAEMLDREFDNFTINDTEATIASNVLIFDEAINKNIAATAKKQYLREQYRKDITRTVYSLQNLNNVILSYTVNDVSDITGDIEEHVVEIMNITGKKTTLKFDIPYINEDGTFRINNQTYLLRTQKVDKMSRKIDPTTVVLSSYYGKLFVGKAFNAFDANVGKWFYKKLRAKEDPKNKAYDSKCNNVVSLGIEIPDAKLPTLYAQIASMVKSFDYSDYGFNFNYDNRATFLPGYTTDDVVKLEAGTVVIVGTYKDNFLAMDFMNTLYEIKNGKLNELGNLFDIINIDSDEMPIEFVRVALLKEAIPIGLLLSYYLGLENLMKLLKVKYSISKTRVKLEKDQYSFKFKDVNLIITRDYGIGDLILAGFSTIGKLIKDFNINELNSRVSFTNIWHRYFTIYSNLSSSVKYVNEINILESMFIDPMTMNVIKQTKGPESFTGLLIEATEMLLDNNFKHPNSVTDMMFKGYERIAGIIYKTLVYAYKDYENASMFSRANIVLDKYAILQKIMGDNSKVAVDDLNPLAFIKQKEDTTYLGDGGRGKEGMVKRTREFNTTEVGIVSEATKDSGSVGITAYMTANPNISTINGLLDTSKDSNELKWENMLSTSSMLTPFGITDDAKRLEVSWVSINLSNCWDALKCQSAAKLSNN